MKVRVASPVSRPVRMSDFRRLLSVRSLSARRDALVRTTRADVSRQAGQRSFICADGKDMNAAFHDFPQSYVSVYSRAES